MFNVCPGCGQYSDEKAIDPTGPFAICSQCKHAHRFTLLPLLVVTGASGSGKTTVALQLAQSLQECVCLESDILWREEFNKPQDEYRDYRNLWLRVAKNIAQAGRPVVLFGTATPGQFEQCTESRYFSGIYYLTFVCQKEELVRRLQNRRSWRNSATIDVLERMVNFNQWLTENAASTRPPMTLLDTTDLTVEQSAYETEHWVRETLNKCQASV
jgi:predicted kinase